MSISSVAVATEAAALVKGPIMAISTPAVITRYFSAQGARDFDTLVTLFADDGVVVDEGQTRQGTTEIRAWRENVASVYEYTTELVGVEAESEGKYVARVHLEGNFPGGAVDLRYRFTVAGDSIRRLEIAP
jgi:ketosteroid isomerase-like protein